MFTNPEILNVIEECELNHQFYTLRWFMLLLVQDLGVDDSLRLWDTLLSAEPSDTDLRGLAKY